MKIFIFLILSICSCFSQIETSSPITTSIQGSVDGGNPSPGMIGEYISSSIASGSSISLTTNTTISVTSISLGAGDWDVQGIVSMSGSAVTVTAISAGINNSISIPSDGSESYSGLLVTLGNFSTSIMCIRKRYCVSSPVTIYLLSRSTFSVGSISSFGSINARRVR